MSSPTRARSSSIRDSRLDSLFSMAVAVASPLQREREHVSSSEGDYE